MAASSPPDLESISRFLRTFFPERTNVTTFAEFTGGGESDSFLRASICSRDAAGA
jgi:hypothetical protein